MFSGRMRTRIVCSGLPDDDKVHPSRGYLAFPCHAPLLSPGAGRLNPGDRTLWFVVKARYVDQLHAILQDLTLAGIEDVVERASLPGLMRAAAAQHCRPMMTTWGGIFLEEEEAYLLARGLIKNIQCLTPDVSNEYVVVGIVFRKIPQAALIPSSRGARVMVPRSDVEPYVSTVWELETRNMLKIISDNKKNNPNYVDDDGYALLPKRYPQPQVTEYQEASGHEEITILLWRFVDLRRLAKYSWQELASQVLRLGPSLQLNCGPQRFPFLFAFRLGARDEIEGAEYVDKNMPREKGAGGRNRSGFNPGIRYGIVPRLQLPGNVPLAWQFARMDNAAGPFPELEPAVIGRIDQQHQLAQEGGVPSLQEGHPGTLPKSVLNTYSARGGSPVGSLGNSGGQGSTDGGTAPPQAAPNNEVAAVYEGWRTPDAPEGRFASTASLPPLAAKVAAVMPAAPSLMEPAQERPSKRTRLASSSADSDLDGSFTQLFGGLEDLLYGEVEDCRYASLFQDEDH